MFFFPAIAKQTVSMFYGDEVDALISQPGCHGPKKVDHRARVHPEDLEDLAERDPAAVRHVLKEAGIDPSFADVSGNAGGWPEV